MPRRSKPKSRHAAPASPSPTARTARTTRAAPVAAPTAPTKRTKPAAPSPEPTPTPDSRAAAAPHGLITATANGGNRGAKVDMQAVYQAVIHGLLTYYQPSDVFQMQAGTYTRDELIAEFQGFVNAAQATKASNQQWRSDIQTERVLELHVRGLRRGVRGITQARFGPQGAQNLQFGYALPKPRKRTAETAAIAVAKSLATRSKRGTMGRVQKSAIKGEVHVAVVVTPTDGTASRSGMPAVDAAHAADTAHATDAPHVADALPVPTPVAALPVTSTSEGAPGANAAPSATAPSPRTPPGAPDG